MTQFPKYTIICVLCFCTGAIFGRLTAPQAALQTSQSQAAKETQVTTYGRFGHVAPTSFEGVETTEPAVIDLEANAKKEQSNSDRKQTEQNTEIHDIAAGMNPSLCSDQKGNFFTTFEGLSTGSKSKAIFFAKSSDGAKSWTIPVDVSRASGNSTHPSIAVENSGAIDIVWIDTTADKKTADVFFARSADGGKVWSKPIDISDSTGECNSPSLAISPANSISVVWIDSSVGSTHPDVFYSVSNNAGQKWAKAEDISNTPGVSSAPTIVIGSDGTVHVAWLDTTPGVNRPDIFYNWAANGSWNKPIDVSNSPKLSSHPTMACGVGDKIFLAWSDNSLKENAPDIWCAMSTKPGEFSKPRNLSDSPGVSSEPAIAADNTGCLAAVWSDTSNGIQNIFASVSFDSLTKTSAAMDLTSGKSMSKHPSVALGSDKLLVVWEQADGDKSTIKSMSKDFSHH